MEVKQERRVKDGSKNYRLMRRRMVITLLVIYWLEGKKKWWIWFLIRWQSRGHIWEESEWGQGWGRQFRPLETLGSGRYRKRIWGCESELHLQRATLHMTHSMKRNAPYAVVLVAEELGHFPSPHPCSQRTTTSYAFLHAHLLPSRLNSFEVNGYSGWGDVGKEWNLSHTSSISFKLHGSWKIKGKGLGAKHILGFIEPHFGFPIPGLGHCIHSARLWRKPFQGWNQSCGIWAPQG